MKRISLRIALASCVLALAIALAGCASGPAPSADKDALKGFWIMDGADQIGFEAVIDIDEDEDGAIVEMMVSDAFLEGTWSTDGTTATIAFDEENGGSASACILDGKLVIGQADGSKLVFTRGDMDEYFGDEEGEDDEEIDLEDLDLEGDDDTIVLDGETGEALETVDEEIDDIAPIGLVDDDTCTIKATGKGTDFTGDPGYRLSITNKFDKTIYIASEETFKVDGKNVEAGMGETVEPGKTVETFLYFSQDQLDGGVDALKNISGKLTVGDDESGDVISTYTVKID